MSVTFYTTNHFWHHYQKFKRAGAKPFLLAGLLYLWLLGGGYLLSRWIL